MPTRTTPAKVSVTPRRKARLAALMLAAHRNYSDQQVFPHERMVVQWWRSHCKHPTHLGECSRKPTSLLGAPYRCRRFGPHGRTRGQGNDAMLRLPAEIGPE